MNKVTKTLATICFYLILAALVSAIISDTIILNQQLLGFIFAIIASVVVFFFAIFLMIVSIILIFGIYDTFTSIMNDYQVTQGQLDDLFVIRIILLVVCITAFIIAVIAKIRIKIEKKKDSIIKVRHYGGFATAGMVLSILGTLASIGIAAILTSLR